MNDFGFDFSILKNVWLKIDHKDTPPIGMAKCLEM